MYFLNVTFFFINISIDLIVIEVTLKIYNSYCQKLFESISVFSKLCDKHFFNGDTYFFNWFEQLLNRS